MKLSLEQIIEAIENGQEPILIINGESYEIWIPEEENDEQ